MLFCCSGSLVKKWIINKSGGVLMKLSLRQKVMSVLLAVYWITIFTLAHRPIPQWVYEAQVSDKSIHFIVYLILVFLLWFSVRPGAKVNWRKAAVWWIVLVMAVYAAADEITQGYVGRQCDFTDFLADMAGTFAGLIMFGFLSFWPGLLAVISISIFGITNLARADVSKLMPVGDAVFHIVAYAALTAVWLKVMGSFTPHHRRDVKRLAAALAGPMAFLLFVKASSAALGRYFQWSGVLVCLAAILIVAVAGQSASLASRTDDSAKTPRRKDSVSS